ncbi:MAG: hypothetical protein IKV94_05780 [Clostridia bacterium]|nr:hypothetical protein [Clostridia bacterium]
MNKITKVFLILFVAVLVCSQVFANDIGNVEDPFINTNPGIGTLNDTVKDVWATVIVIVQILAVAAVVFAGLRYMFASSDAKADIKKSMGILIVGAVLVFAATTVLSFVTGLAKTALQ